MEQGRRVRLSPLAWSKGVGCGCHHRAIIFGDNLCLGFSSVLWVTLGEGSLYSTCIVGMAALAMIVSALAAY